MSSSPVPLPVAEPKTDAIRGLAAEDATAVDWALTQVEIAAALWRRHRLGDLAGEDVVTSRTRPVASSRSRRVLTGHDAAITLAVATRRAEEARHSPRVAPRLRHLAPNRRRWRLAMGRVGLARAPVDSDRRAVLRAVYPRPPRRSGDRKGVPVAGWFHALAAHPS